MGKIMKDFMSDDEIRILGTVNPDTEPPKRRQPRRRAAMALTVIAAAGVIAAAMLFFTDGEKTGRELTDGNASGTPAVVSVKDSVRPGPAYTAVTDTTVGGLPLHILTPSGGRMELYVGSYPMEDPGVILAAHAADLRADNGMPAGAFVVKGKLIAKGHSKYGFCAIVNGTVAIGRQIETPLFERAIEKDGSFFRQYSLVSNGKVVSVPSKGKAMRRALCLRDGELCLMETAMPETYGDFAKALENLGVSEALALVGGSAAAMWRERDGRLMQNGCVFGEDFPYENYIVWRK